MMSESRNPMSVTYVLSLSLSLSPLSLSVHYTISCTIIQQSISSVQYAEAWVEVLIHSLHKKGSVHSTDNYRGISLLNINFCSRLYRSISL